MPLQYKVDVLEELKKRGINTNKLRKEKLLSEGVIQALREKKPISWANVEKICSLLQCKIEDVLEYIPDTV